MKFCSNCGAKLDPGASYCPKCGHKVEGGDTAKQIATETAAKAKSAATVAATTAAARAKQGLKQLQGAAKSPARKRYLRWASAAFAVLLAIFFAYRLLYLPGVVRNAVDANVLNQGGYTAKANTLTKKVVITTDDLKLERLIDAIKANDYDQTRIGAEMQLASLEKALPGNWTVEIQQHQMKGSQTVLWRYQGDKETIRYQNSDECKRAHKMVMAAKAKQQSTDDAVTRGVTGGIVGGLIGAFLAR
ncbi:zinc-ribbon domain-containing protein [Lacticaseibacillus suibinensis]|uniref:zinc-ribbon domain-containing protein n=1 Tax=Lacticaseibacillus suibinensis TaxID=2486011 RepID=UPI000F7878F4|nr:zinc ribbon domain-containing protein [Lacticaseibacillus suibinensis]